MKPPDKVKAEFVRGWLDRVDADWRLCHRLATDLESYPEAVGFHCQQAAEKYLKGYLTWEQVEFPKTYDIKRLLELIGSGNPDLAKDLDEVPSLTPYAVEYRYPGEYPPPTSDDITRATDLADKVRNRIHDYLRDKLGR